MMIRARLAKLEGKAGAGTLPLAVRAWLGQALSPAERHQAAIEMAAPLSPTDWSSMSKEAREWLQG
jgi:hypothetical protein